MAGFEVRQGQGKIVQPIKTNRITNNTKGTMRGFILKKNCAGSGQSSFYDKEYK